jgi:hypothetical protein
VETGSSPEVPGTLAVPSRTRASRQRRLSIGALWRGRRSQSVSLEEPEPTAAAHAGATQPTAGSPKGLRMRSHSTGPPTSPSRAEPSAGEEDVVSVKFDGRLAGPRHSPAALPSSSSAATSFDSGLESRPVSRSLLEPPAPVAAAPLPASGKPAAGSGAPRARIEVAPAVGSGTVAKRDVQGGSKPALGRVPSHLLAPIKPPFLPPPAFEMVPQRRSQFPPGGGPGALAASTVAAFCGVICCTRGCAGRPAMASRGEGSSARPQSPPLASALLEVGGGRGMEEKGEAGTMGH